jgi:glycine cleavage system regulatory protein
LTDVAAMAAESGYHEDWWDEMPRPANMSTSIVLTVIGEDHPGIVESLSEVLAEHDGNWTQSSMSSLAGQFAGILLATVPEANADACIAALEALESKGLRVVHDITRVLAQHRVNVQELETEVESASMSGGALFKATARLLVPEGVDLRQLEERLEDLANELMVDIRFED